MLTLEPSASFWDCGEFIAASYKLQVVHAPGAPLFLMFNKLFTLLSFGNTSSVAFWVNTSSAMVSAFGVMFLFWTITIIARKLIVRTNEDYTIDNLILIFLSGTVGAMACTFLDSYWFSAVEGEVYALSSAFGALVLWLAFKWEDAARENDPRADRYLVLIAFAIGLSLGVHLLSMLVIPAVAVIYYFNKIEPSVKRKPLGFLIACGVGFAIVGILLQSVLSGIPGVMASWDKYFVNGMGMGIGTGAYVFIAITAALLLLSIYASNFMSNQRLAAYQLFPVYFLLVALPIYFSAGTAVFVVCLLGLAALQYIVLQKPERYADVLRKSTLAFTFILLGFSSYAMVIIRAKANPPINIGSPDNLYSLISYINREQYGERPLLYGEKYNLDPAYDVDYEQGMMNYYIGEEDGKKKYLELGRKLGYTYDRNAKVFFPRIYSWQDDRHIRLYRNLLQPDFNIVDQRGETEPVLARIENTGDWRLALQMANAQAEAMGRDYISVKDDVGFGANMRYFFQYQFRYMYMRYFMWNFAGRENDIQGMYGNTDGHWISGIKFVDEIFSPGLSSQKNLPDSQKENPGRNKFYFIPLILGIIGLYYHAVRDSKTMAVIAVLFLTTGVIQMIYLNQPPVEPRERDYTLVTSFCTFTIWLGLGVIMVYDLLRRSLQNRMSTIGAGLICLSAPVIMGVQGWDDHNRSNRYITRDFARNYLESCAPNAIIFTQGDNDTYPLWYAQEVEGIRTDVRVLNLSLLGVDWYVNQCRRKVNDSDPIKLTLGADQVRGNKRDAVRFFGNVSNWDQSQYYDLRDVLAFVASENVKDKVQLQGGEFTNYLPTRKFMLPFDKEQVVSRGIVHPSDSAKVLDAIYWDLAKNTLLKNDLVVLDIIANNIYDRPIYFAISVSPDASLGIDDHFQMEGLAYRIVPIAQTDCRRCEGGFMYGDSAACNFATISDCLRKHQFGQAGRVQPEIMYDNVMNKYQFGNLEKPNVYLDENILRMTYNIRANYGRLADALAERGEFEKAVEVLDRSLAMMPDDKVHYNLYLYTYPETYYRAGADDKARDVARKLIRRFAQELDYYLSMSDNEFERYLELDRNAVECTMRAGQDISSRLSVFDAIAGAATRYNDTLFAAEADSVYTSYLQPVYSRIADIERKYCPGVSRMMQQNPGPAVPQ
jgi:tetratricopeptide (TPR) repeat protein